MATTNPTENLLIPPEWLHDLVTLAEIEGPQRAADLIAPGDGADWRAFKAKIAAGDELHYFTSPPTSFPGGGGRMGYVLLRGGRQVAVFVALMS